MVVLGCGARVGLEIACKGVLVGEVELPGRVLDPCSFFEKESFGFQDCEGVNPFHRCSSCDLLDHMREMVWGKSGQVSVESHIPLGFEVVMQCIEEVEGRLVQFGRLFANGVLLLHKELYGFQDGCSLELADNAADEEVNVASVFCLHFFLFLVNMLCH